MSIRSRQRIIGKIKGIGTTTFGLVIAMYIIWSSILLTNNSILVKDIEEDTDRTVEIIDGWGLEE